MNYTFCSILLTAANQTAAQDLIGSGYFTAGYSPNGEAPVTNYISSGPFDNGDLNKVLNSKLFEEVTFGMETNTFGLMPVNEPVTE